jgi:uncharacterized protein (TIGR02271 family)
MKNDRTDLNREDNLRKDTIRKEIDVTETQRATDRAETIPVVEENLEVGKKVVETKGGVRVQSRVTETPVHEEVNLREEHVNVERHAVNRPATAADTAEAFRDRTIEMREHAEKPVVAKTARVVEEVSVGKTATNRTEHITDTVRRTDVEIVPVPTETRVGFEKHGQTIRSSYNNRFASSGMPYENYEPAYRYGYNLRGDRNFSGRDWNSIEPTVRTTWETHNKGTWERFKDAIREGFDLDK